LISIVNSIPNITLDMTQIDTSVDTQCLSIVLYVSTKSRDLFKL